MLMVTKLIKAVTYYKELPIVNLHDPSVRLYYDVARKNK